MSDENVPSRSERRKVGPRIPRSPRLTVEVDAETIAAAERENSAHCMIADAIKKCYPNAKSVAVDLQTIRLTMDGLRLHYLTPYPEQRALLRFDQGIHQEPFSFKLKGAHVTKPKKLKMSEPSGRGRGSPRAANLPSAARLVTGDGRSGSAGPTRVGGHPPPHGPLSNSGRTGMRRAFGIRAMKL